MTSKDLAKQKISELVIRFSEQYESYRKAEYNETLTRRDFIDPFFKALGWDVDNESGNAEAYREVIHEDRIKIGKATKAPDYSFRLPGGSRLFFVEAKKPSVAVKDEIQPAYQVRRYGWSAKLPISLITDFEELAIYDCTKKPATTDKAAVARIKYLTFEQYLSEFDFIWDTFSKERVLKGSFDKFIQNDTYKKGTATVDKEFLQSLDSWRTLLAEDICKNNKKLDEEELNFVVQQAIDRLIFLRIAEDRSVEVYGSLKECLKSGNYYNNLFKIFLNADDKYNSGLFDLKKDKLSKNVIIENKIIKTIINQLYYPECPYEFSVLSVEILGSAYEQFLGKQITIDKNHKAIVEIKLEVRKAGGVYYTPQSVVNYIVNRTVGQKLLGKSPQDLDKFRIIDPACGSGSFLIGAYQYLLDWHKDFYNKNKSALTKKSYPLTPEGNLTTAEKKRILLNNIFGVDLDVNAVEVTKLSLLLKCMEGETEASINTQLKLFNERVLPTLDENIKSGNSLIDSSFYDTQLEFGEDRKIKPFDFDKAFPYVFKQKGFDVLIGNPPWGAEFSIETQTFIKIKFLSAKERSLDSYSIFVERSLELLNKTGLMGFILPDTFLRKDDFVSFRSHLLSTYSLLELVETGPVFSQVRDTWCCVMTLSKAPPAQDAKVKHKRLNRFIVSAEERLFKFGKENWDFISEINQEYWQKSQRNVIAYKATDDEQSIIHLLQNNPTLGSSIKFKISRGEEGSKTAIKESSSGDYFMMIPDDVKMNTIKEGKKVSSKGLTSGKITAIYSHPKIWIIRIQKMRWIQRIVSGVDERINSAGMKTLQTITSTSDNLDDLYFLQAILSSNLINFWCVNFLSDDINGSFLSRLPIKNVSGGHLMSLYKDVVKIARELAVTSIGILDLKLQSKIDTATSRATFLKQKLNSLVYALYELDEKQIQIVEAKETEILESEEDE